MELGEYMYTVQLYEKCDRYMYYRTVLIFRGSKCLQIAVFDNFFENFFCKYAVEAGDGAKCQNFSWNIFANGIEFTKITKI